MMESLFIIAYCLKFLNNYPFGNLILFNNKIDLRKISSFFVLLFLLNEFIINYMQSLIKITVLFEYSFEYYSESYEFIFSFANLTKVIRNRVDS